MKLHRLLSASVAGTVVCLFCVNSALASGQLQAWSGRPTGNALALSQTNSLGGAKWTESYGAVYAHFCDTNSHSWMVPLQRTTSSASSTTFYATYLGGLAGSTCVQVFSSTRYGTYYSSGSSVCETGVIGTAPEHNLGSVSAPSLGGYTVVGYIRGEGTNCASTPPGILHSVRW